MRVNKYDFKKDNCDLGSTALTTLESKVSLLKKIKLFYFQDPLLRRDQINFKEIFLLLFPYEYEDFEYFGVGGQG